MTCLGRVAATWLVGGSMVGGDDRKCGDAGGREPDVTFEGCEAETEVSSEDMNRALELLARWALHRGQKG